MGDVNKENAVEKVEKPAEHFEKPKDVVKDQDLTPR